MLQVPHPRSKMRFNVFEADLDAPELRRVNKHWRLQEQHFPMLAMLLERTGAVVTRDVLAGDILGSDGGGLRLRRQQAASKIRDAPGDSAERPYAQSIAGFS
jgi:DNA-binding winged helix-turn-helix (wHTH) protein